jgi:HD-GYP domain-containing protein (c-di-GMP phosphodiesterase class II)
MAEQPVIGERILRRTPQLGHLAPIVRHEHERWDGGGYPDGLARTEIPIASRIILACDAYNAMITTRPYREAMSSEHSTAELRAKAGTPVRPGGRGRAARAPRRPQRGGFGSFGVVTSVAV